MSRSALAFVLILHSLTKSIIILTRLSLRPTDPRPDGTTYNPLNTTRRIERLRGCEYG
ncbi:hypothetical protein AURDEDRAFT_111242 [Auricularia subglabra TFB-10046 SS5]|nr:hypothetical protein AURDEDRAFT_111242 [Auricularia subglabra TFB-10046 SS5]